MSAVQQSIAWFETLGRHDVPRVGGKNASLGEMVQTLEAKGIRVPPGFATTSDAYWNYVSANKLKDRMTDFIAEWEAGKATLAETGLAIRNIFLKGDWPAEMESEIRTAYRELSSRAGVDEVEVAVRSSATAEDLPDASFAGQQETFLNIRGETALIDACRRCYASLFTDRAISYRKTKGFDHMKVALSIGVQQMVRSDIGGSGVMFSIDTETGFDKVVLINAAWGLGENVVQGAVDPDEYQVFKPLLDNRALSPIIEKKKGAKDIKMIYAVGDNPTRNVPTSKVERAAWVLSDREIVELARWATTIEQHYGCPMDMEWARDGNTGDMFIVQARPETVQARRDVGAFKSYTIHKKGKILTKGLSIGDAIASGQVCLIESAKDIDQFVDGSILVTQTTDPDWVPIMKRAAAIITDHGGRTSHAAIVSRELGLPAVVGSGNATEILHTGQEVTISCAEGDEGFVYEGIADFSVEKLDVTGLPATKTAVMLNLANPGSAFRWWRLPADGIGLARMEFVVSNAIRVHPMALVHFDTLKDEEAKAEIAKLTAGYDNKPDYFVDKLALGLGRLAAAVYPKPVIIRMSDFKTNEYAGLVGGAEFEPAEENPMIGFRGASRYYSPRYREGFALECRAIKRLRDEMGFTNVVVMIPFCRSVGEADKVLGVMAENGLKRGENGLQIYVMCEIPSNVILAAKFADRFDGFSIGSNDLTQLTLGVDRDSGELADLFDEQDEAVKWMIEKVISEANKAGAKIGLCGQAPSDHPEFAEFLVDCGIDSMSVSPDSFIAVKQIVAKAEKAKAGRS
ncbi:MULTISPECIES: phosphoenolpyruvate synthase [Alphaproteobacteria]|uniref:Phosphoenolpyruvate synthase n=2 Tax=Alphaproteobacteria TaxID=28211 RepID=A0A512HN86_9HYPH|nr:MULTISPECIES: phosphoenolpyruvate synthase [Alphaproteobacteria]GEO86918.1 phosphoenolpyruvate synthase [Ciceribacter naphthalenivorans]GLR22232.1 phosphoenolpyruvate synthase [Ciceribacter naphthalenivorans]GLT05088.1 phosphoenolpyruvate synthase [Sphingomonas psychrolutea]